MPVLRHPDHQHKAGNPWLLRVPVSFNPPCVSDTGPVLSSLWRCRQRGHRRTKLVELNTHPGVYFVTGDQTPPLSLLPSSRPRLFYSSMISITDRGGKRRGGCRLCRAAVPCGVSRYWLHASQLILSHLHPLVRCEINFQRRPHAVCSRTGENLPHSVWDRDLFFKLIIWSASKVIYILIICPHICRMLKSSQLTSVTVILSIFFFFPE